MQKNILIIGATGFIGINLVRKLVENGDNITILVRNNSDCSAFSNLKIKKAVGDVLDVNSIKNAMKDCDVVYHLAAHISFNRNDYDKLFEVNVIGTKNILKNALDLSIKKVVYVSACAVFGFSNRKDKLLNEETVYKPTKNNAYAYTKQLAEEEVMNVCRNGLNAVIVNPSTVYGREDKQLNSGFVIKLIKTNKFLVAPPGGTTVVSVYDVVYGIMLAMEKGARGNRYILANEMMEFTELYKTIAKVIGEKRHIYKMPGLLYYPSIISAEILNKALKIIGKNLSQVTPEMIKSTFGFKYYDSSKARKELGWQPKISFSVAVKQALDYYIENKLL